MSLLHSQSLFTQQSYRQLRITTGLIMWFYLGGHMLNHSLGLISLNLAERSMRTAVGLVHFWPITVLLYGAFLIHLLLALFGIWKRPSLRMQWSEVLRSAWFGLSVIAYWACVCH